MTVLREDLQRTGSYLIWEVAAYQSKETGIVAPGHGSLKAGTVLMKQDDGHYAPLKSGDDPGQAAGILFQECETAGAAQKRAITVRDAAVKREKLLFPEGMTDDQKAVALNDLLALGITSR